MKFLLKIVLPIIVVGVCSYIYYIYINSYNSVPPYHVGVYESEYGVQEITLTSIDENKLKVVGTGILPGPGNMADQETIDAKTTNIEGVIEMNGRIGVYTDPQDTDCKLYFEFDEKNGFSVNDGRVGNCSVLVDNFTGNYSKVEQVEQ